MAKKFKISLVDRLPDFKVKAVFNLPNGEETDIVFTVKHLSASEMQDLYQKETSDLAYIKTLVTGWDLEDEFNEENALKLVNLYPAALIALTGQYMQALAGHRVKN